MQFHHACRATSLPCVLQVVTARSKQAQELAILKLYAVLSQAHFVKQQAAEWEGAFLGIMTLGFPLLLKHTAEVVIQQDRGYSTMVGGLSSQASPNISCCLLLCHLGLLEPLLANLTAHTDLQSEASSLHCAACHHLLVPA